MTTPDTPRASLWTFEFLGLCLLIFLTYCNTTVFYSLYVYLTGIGIGPNWRGLVIGASSLSTIVCFLLLSPLLTRRNAPACAGLGALLLMGCGLSYLWVHELAGLLVLRVVNGAAIYLLSASIMTLLVAAIPPARSGQGFGLYSVAILLPYSIVPLAFDHLSPTLPSLAHGYAAMSLFLAPAMAVVAVIAKRQRATAKPPQPRMSHARMFGNAKRPPIAMLLAINALYILVFSSMFFLAEGFFASKGYDNVGAYFTIQTCCMIAVRVFANRIFDQVNKLWLIRLSLALTSLAFGMALFAQSLAALYATSFVMGLGMGVGSPSMSALMVDLSEPELKAVNSNLMVMAMQVGGFLGPLVGAAAVNALGYGGFLYVGLAAGLAGLGLGFAFPLPAGRLRGTA